MSSNPFEQLGVPKDIVLREYALGNEDRLRKIANGVFRLFSKFYHPDKEDGDGEIFKKIADAHEEINDGPLMVADYYVGESRAREYVSRLNNRKKEQDSSMALGQVVRLLENTRSLSVAPWLENSEAIFGLGDPKIPRSLVKLKNIGNKILVYEDIVPSDVHSTEVSYDDNLGKWVITDVIPEYVPSVDLRHNFDDTVRQLIDDYDNRYENDHMIDKIIKVETLMGTLTVATVIGAVDREAYYKQYGLNIDGTSIDINASIRETMASGLSSATEDNRILWEDFETSWWSSLVKPKARAEDALVLGNFSRIRPVFGIITPLIDIKRH